MSARHSEQLRIGTGRVDGERVEFVWAPGTRFVTVQFMDRSPRGVANLARIDTAEPVVVPMSSHRQWLSRGDRAAVLAAAGRARFASAIDAPGLGARCGYLPWAHVRVSDVDRDCETAFGFISGRGAWARAR